MGRCCFHFWLAVPILLISPCIVKGIADWNWNSSPHNSFDVCDTKAYINGPGHNISTICDRSLTQTHNEICTDVCQKVFRLTIITQQLFAITMKSTFLNMLALNCGVCGKCNVTQKLNKVTHFDASLLNTSDVVFPIVAISTVESIHGFHFLPTYSVPSSYYFTRRKTSKIIVQDIIQGCSLMWPIIIIYLLFATMSGFVVWAIETWKNPDDFPRPFYSGMFDGFWWSFISMTTVGYGDRVPKSYVGRVYAFLWILLGTVVSALFTGALTAEIIESRSAGNTDMAGKKVGVLQERLHDISIVVQHGGTIEQSSKLKTLDGLRELLDLLGNRTIAGFVIDANTYYFVRQKVKQTRHHDIRDKMISLKLMKTEKYLKTGTLSCGFLFRNKTSYDYFKGYFDTNLLHIGTCNSLRMNEDATYEDYDINIFKSGPDSTFNDTLIYCLAILGFMTCIGIFIEVIRYFRKKTSANDIELNSEIR